MLYNCQVKLERKKYFYKPIFQAGSLYRHIHSQILKMLSYPCKTWNLCAYVTLIYIMSKTGSKISKWVTSMTGQFTEGELWVAFKCEEMLKLTSNVRDANYYISNHHSLQSEWQKLRKRVFF